MNYTITGRAQPHGLAFEPAQLAPIGIRPGGTAWGVFVDSPKLDEYADLSDPAKKSDNQSTHLVVSAVHPDRWLACFRLSVILERKRGATDDRGSQSVAYGLFDTLARCGVNVLDTSKALMGYDAVSVSALCEFPKLRAEALVRIAQCDEAARQLAPERPMTSPNAALEQSRGRLQQLRESAFRDIGLRLIHHLAVLQARLMLADELRFWCDRDRTGAFRSAFHGSAAGSGTSALLGDSYTREAEDDPLDAPWFVNRRILDLSENPFYVNYDQLSRAQLAKLTTKEEEALTGCENGVAQAVFDELVVHLQRHESRDSTVVRTHTEGRHPPCESSFWSRCGMLKDGLDLRSQMLRGVVQRAFAFPVLVSPLPTLSYARVWALPHHAVVGQNNAGLYFREIEFQYDGAVLSPRPFRAERVKGEEKGVDSPKEASAREQMPALFSTINRWSRLERRPVPRRIRQPRDDNFTFRSLLVAAVSTSERFMRVRFVRHTTAALWGTIAVTFTATDIDTRGRDDVSSRGLLAVCSSVLAKQGFRIEDINFQYDRIDCDAESGTLNLVVQAGNAIQSDGGLEDYSALDEPDELSREIRESVDTLLPSSIRCSSVDVYLGVPDAS